jgi:hypothetical protein
MTRAFQAQSTGHERKTRPELNRRDAERSKNNDRIAKRAKTAKKNRNETADTLPRALNGEESSVRTSGVKPAHRVRL